MANYVNEQKFFDWYRSVAKKPRNESELLNDVFSGYCNTGSEIFTLPASKTVTGKDESYRFRFEHICACSADTVIIHF